MFSVADSLCYYAENAEKFLRPRKRRYTGCYRPDEAAADRLQTARGHRPDHALNGPFVLVMNQAVQAILAGNAVVAKAPR